MFNPSRLRVARQRLGLTRTGLAETSGVSLRSLTNYETGKLTPSDETLHRLSTALSVPIPFFMREDIDVIPTEAASFRKLSKTTATTRDAVLTNASLAVEFFAVIESKFKLPTPSIPTLEQLTPEQAADLVRHRWNLADRPISNMVHLVESKGVRVSSLPHDHSEVDAFCFVRDGIPFVFLNTSKSAERQRFDAAHELGHLVLHQDGKTTGRTAEDQANEFASAFLMPKAAILASIRNVYSIDHLIKIKANWRVSLSALTVRLHRLHLLTDWRYRDFCIQIRTRYRDTEPEGIEREKSVVWQKVMRSLWADKMTQLDISKHLGVPEAEITALIFGVVNNDVRAPAQSTGLKIVHQRT